MKFESVDSTITTSRQVDAAHKLTGLLLELGVREGNTFVGSGRGGNNFQMLALVQMNHRLVNSARPIDVVSDVVYWDVHSLLSMRRGVLRKELDKTFSLIPEGIKYVSIALHANVNHPERMIESLSDSTLGPFGLKTTTQILTGEKINLGSLPYASQIIVACILCAELIKYLDLNPQTEKMRLVGEALSTVEMEVFLIAVRKCIGIDRIIKFDIDEHPAWAHSFNRINKTVN